MFSLSYILEAEAFVNEVIIMRYFFRLHMPASVYQSVVVSVSYPEPSTHSFRTCLIILLRVVGAPLDGPSVQWLHSQTRVASGS